MSRNRRLHRVTLILGLFLVTAGFFCPEDNEVTPPPPVTSVTLDPRIVDLIVGQEVVIMATVQNAPDGAQVSWQSAAPGIASVDPSGKVIAAAQGITVITASIQGHEGVVTDAAVVRVEAAAEGIISGTVTGNGLAMSDVTIRLTGTAERVTVSGTGGVYQFVELAPGPYTVTISSYPPGVTFPATSVDVTLPPGLQITVNFAGTYPS